MQPDQPAAQGPSGETARRRAAVQPTSGDAHVIIGDTPELVADLRSLADYLAPNPAVAVRLYGWKVAVHAEGTDSEQFSQVDARLVDTFGVPRGYRAVGRALDGCRLRPFVAGETWR